MANRFERVAAPVADKLTVRLWRTAGGARGDVTGPAGTGLRMGDGGNLTADEALAAGCGLANRYDLTVVVIDEDGVWPERWGRLERGPA